MDEEILKVLSEALAWTTDERKDITDKERLQEIKELLLKIIP